ncbi:MAG: hypothetical protein KBT21_01170 [Treponema sp.]|nr:hypothetical protein [Candidatus Treponema merdequi]
MYEIELKAHVHDKNRTVSLINSFADYCGTTIKDDEYFHFELNLKNENPISKIPHEHHITCRLRHEEYTFPDNSTKTQDLLTYKKKERRTNADGTTYEVNEENETVLSEPEAVRKLLLDTGYTSAYTKHKDVMQWKTKTPYGEAHLELCGVQSLGDFLEIEVVAKNCDNENEIRKELENLIIKSGLTLSDIEKKYYSELLKEINNAG